MSETPAVEVQSEGEVALHEVAWHVVELHVVALHVVAGEVDKHAVVGKLLVAHLVQRDQHREVAPPRVGVVVVRELDAPAQMEEHLVGVDHLGSLAEHLVAEDLVVVLPSNHFLVGCSARDLLVVDLVHPVVVHPVVVHPVVVHPVVVHPVVVHPVVVHPVVVHPVVVHPVVVHPVVVHPVVVHPVVVHPVVVHPVVVHLVVAVQHHVPGRQVAVVEKKFTTLIISVLQFWAKIARTEAYGISASIPVPLKIPHHHHQLRAPLEHPAPSRRLRQPLRKRSSPPLLHLGRKCCECAWLHVAYENCDMDMCVCGWVLHMSSINQLELVNHCILAA